MSRFAQPFSSRLCMFCAYTGPRFQMSVYRTIGPLVSVDDAFIEDIYNIIK